MTRAWSGSPANHHQPITTLRLQRSAGATVVPIQVTHLYRGVQNNRHTTVREEINLASGDVVTQIIHGGKK